MLAHWNPSRQPLHRGAAGVNAAGWLGVGAVEVAGAAEDGAVELLGLGLSRVRAGVLLPPQAVTAIASTVRARVSRVRRTRPSWGTQAGPRRRGRTGSLTGRERPTA